MRFALQPHPDSPPAPIASLEAEISRTPAGVLALRYAARGEIAALRLAPETAATRTDELWRATCFEAFLAPGEGEGYFEFNFAPSTQWAAYRFDAYRAGMRVAEAIPAPQIVRRQSGEALELAVTLDLAALKQTPWRLALAAVIEAADGSISYWALTHAPGRPDFHHRDCFVCELPTA